MNADHTPLMNVIRLRVLLAFMEDGQRSPSEIAKELHVGVSSVAYHVRELVKAGILVSAGQRSRRAVIEQFYEVGDVEQLREGVDDLLGLFTRIEKAMPQR